MRIAVIGAGAVGGHFGARLARAGNDVSFIARGRTLVALRDAGIRVESPLGDFAVDPVSATDDPSQLGPVDAVLVCVKAWQVPEAAAAIPPLLRADTCVVPLCNGIEAAGQLEQRLGQRPVVGGLCHSFSMVLAPGQIQNYGGPLLIEFGELSGGPSPRLDRLAAAFEGTGVQASVSADIQLGLWAKLLTVSINTGMGAATRSPVGVWRSHPETRRLAQQAMDEIMAVGAARGVAFTAATKDSAWALWDSMHPTAATSIQRDLADGRPSELDAVLGAVVRLGEAAGVRTPAVGFLHSILLPQERAARAQ
ncbi:MAG: 2-dehydropantoate 2-reductase [Dehalococcoidia bacterium]|nr:2-dehydropantoate 2-reductase [Dehalococcoidia bacterium]